MHVIKFNQVEIQCENTKGLCETSLCVRKVVIEVKLEIARCNTLGPGQN